MAKDNQTLALALAALGKSASDEAARQYAEEAAESAEAAETAAGAAAISAAGAEAAADRAEAVAESIPEDYSALAASAVRADENGRFYIDMED